MRLMIAWIASAFAGAVAYPAGGLIAATLMGARPALSSGLLIFGLYVLVFCLVLQLVYGGLLYLMLGKLGMLNLPVLIVAYLAPIALWVSVGGDTGKDLLMAIPKILCGLSVAVVTWLCLTKLAM